MKKAFLLGAGASVDAGLVPSAGLTRAIAEQLGRGFYPDPVGQLLHVVVGAMIQRDASVGGDAFAVPDVERVFSAVRDLRRRDALDISAFVGRWSGPIDAATGPSGLPEAWGRQFRDALVGEHAGDLELEAAFERGVVAMTEGRSSTLFAELEHRMLRTLIQLLQVDDARLGYLSPMLESSDLIAIATLNYDLAVEGAARQLGKSLDTGLDAWQGGYRWAWSSNADVRLLKLHGSLDYALRHARQKGRRMHTEHLTPTSGEIAVNPALVFGAHSKLRSDGPFLAMLVEFDNLLAQTEWLTIVGYSFRDSHINAALTRWMNSDVSRRLSIVDPAVQKWSSASASPSAYFTRLLAGASGEGVEFQRPVSWPRLPLELVPSTAAEGLRLLHM